MIQKIRAWAEKSGQWLVILFGFMLPLSTAATNAILGLLLLCWVCGPWKSQILQGLNHTLVRAFGVLWLWALIAMSYSAATYSAMGSAFYEVSKGWLLLFLLPFCQKEWVAQRAKWAFLAAMGLTLGAGALKMAGILSIGAKFSEAAAFKNHIVTSYFMAFAAYALADEAYRQKAYRWFLVLGAALAVFYVFFMNMGRTGHVLLLVLAMLYVIQHWRWKGLCLGLPLVLLSVVGMAFLSDHFWGRFGSLMQLGAGVQSQDISLMHRLTFAETSFLAALQHPWLGWGTGAFSKAYAEIAEPLGLMLTDNPHNQYLLTWVEQGIVGVILLALVFHRIFQSIARLSAEYRPLAEALLLSVVIGCLGNSLLKDFSEHLFFLWWLAILFSRTPSVYTRAEPHKPLPPISAKESLKCDTHFFH